MKRSILVLAMLLFVLDTLALADLTNIQGSVYQTGSGAGSLYWYLNMNSLANKTWAGQEGYAANLEVNIEGIEDNWHIATQQEVDQLLV
ncbi:MAG TPA: hypothetical protein DIU00_22230 [Phycisphaerales bacterium]|nr:hypothetical protein [Phycisphaerales bacterium]